jgi:hypothetical protein
VIKRKKNNAGKTTGSSKNRALTPKIDKQNTTKNYNIAMKNLYRSNPNL